VLLPKISLINGAKRSPDVAWIRIDRRETLTEEEQEGFAPIYHDFVAELRSSEDKISALQDKMKEYMENGASLGWLFDPQNKTVYVYKPNQPVQKLQNPNILSGDPGLPGLIINVPEIW
jgi:Uma2 family endonuclease